MAVIGLGKQTVDVIGIGKQTVIIIGLWNQPVIVLVKKDENKSKNVLLKHNITKNSLNVFIF